MNSLYLNLIKPNLKKDKIFSDFMQLCDQYRTIKIRTNVDTPEDGEKLSEEEISKRKAHTHKLLEKAGAHYVIDSIADIEPVIEDVNKRLANGERP